MSSKTKEVASQWREQMQKGYLKLAVLFALTKGPLHGYQMLKHITEWTLGMITPTAGALYPALKNLENKGLIKGEWIPAERKKVYHITDEGREVFREAVERHFKLASSVRSWFFKGLADLKVVEEMDLSPIMEPAVRILLLKEEAFIGERVEALEKLKQGLQHLAVLFNKMMEQIKLRQEELKSGERRS